MKGKIAVVTGGSTGMGRACSLALAAQGAHVWVVSELPVHELEAFCTEVRAVGFAATAATCDVTDRKAIADLTASIERAHGRLDILVNCAGVFRSTPLLDSSPDDVELMFRVNVLGPIELMRRAAPLMQRSGGGAIVNITSAAAIIGFTATAAYSASKAALTHYTRTVAAELRGTGIRVNAVAPGSVMTPMVGFPDGSEGPSGEQLEALERRLAMSNSPYGNAMMTPEDVANAVLFLVSDAGRGMHGACILADQGITAAMAPGRG